MTITVTLFTDEAGNIVGNINGRELPKAAPNIDGVAAVGCALAAEMMGHFSIVVPDGYRSLEESKAELPALFASSFSAAAPPAAPVPADEPPPLQPPVPAPNH